jgi:hypothetical protein
VHRIFKFLALFLACLNVFSVCDAFSAEVPFIIATNRSFAEGNNGTNLVTMDVRLSTTSTVPVTVDFRTITMTATAGADFLSHIGTVTFPVGVTNATLSLAIIGENIYESDETLRIDFTNALGGELMQISVTNTIVNDDPMPTASVGDLSFLEGDSGTRWVNIPVTLSNPSSFYTFISYYTLDGTANSGSDYNNQPPAVTSFPPGALNITLPVAIRGNTINEPDETFTVTITPSLFAGVLIGRAAATCTILNDDAIPGRLNHFWLGSVATPQYAGQGFALVAEARDAFNQRITNFAVAVPLSANVQTNGSNTIVTPATLVFTQGLWSGFLNLSATNTNVVLRLDAGEEHVGFSNPFDVHPLTIMTLTVLTNPVEGAGLLTNALRVVTSRASANAVTFFATSSIPNTVTIASNLVLPAGQTSRVYAVTVPNDSLRNGTRVAVIEASARGYTTNSATMTVRDNEIATLSLVAPASVREGDGTRAVQLRCSAPVGADVTVMLTSSDSTEITVPPSVILPVGQTSVVFNLTVIDDGEIDGTRPVSLTAHVDNWTNGVAGLSVLDNESTNLSLELIYLGPLQEGFPTITNLGRVGLSGTLTTNFVVQLTTTSSQGPAKLIVASPLIIIAGQTNVTFAASFLENTNFDGAQPVTLSASAAAFVGASVPLSIGDNEIAALLLDRIAGPKTNSVGFGLNIRVRDVFGAPIYSFPMPLTISAVGDHGPLLLIPSNVTAGISATVSVTFASADTNVRLTVRDAQGHMAVSNPFDVVLAGWQSLPIASADAAYDPVRKRIYAAGVNGIYERQLVRIDPARALVEQVFSLPGTPGRMAADASGQFIYIDLTDSNAIVRFNLTSQVFDQSMALGTNLYTEEMEVAPDNPRILAVSRRKVCCGSVLHHSTVIFTNGLMLPLIEGQFTGANTICFGATGGRLYGYNNETTEMSFYRFDVSTTGISGWTTRFFWQAFHINMKYLNGRVFAGEGQVRDPETSAFIGRIPQNGIVAVDGRRNRVFYVNSAVHVFDASTLVEKGFVYLDSNAAQGNFVAWDEGFAYAAGGQQFVIMKTPLIGDTDNDGLPDWWELQSFGSLASVAGAPTADSDGDGVSNLGEWEAGTNPTDAASVFRTSALSLSSTNLKLGFPTVIGKRYGVETAAAVPGGWLEAVNDIVGTGSNRMVVLPIQGTQQFFRVRLQE